MYNVWERDQTFVSTFISISNGAQKGQMETKISLLSKFIAAGGNSQFMLMAMLARTGWVWLLLLPRHSSLEFMSCLVSCSSFIVFLLLPGEISSQEVSTTCPALHQLTLELGQPANRRVKSALAYQLSLLLEGAPVFPFSNINAKLSLQDSITMQSSVQKGEEFIKAQK